MPKDHKGSLLCRNEHKVWDHSPWFLFVEFCAFHLKNGNGEENTFMKQFWNSFPSTIGDAPVKQPWANLLPHKAFFPTSRPSYYHYIGSYTSPPCTTNTIWVILSDPVQVSHAQLTEFRSSLSELPPNVSQLLFDPSLKFPGTSVESWNPEMGVNNRPIQALGGRVVYFFNQDPGGSNWNGINLLGFACILLTLGLVFFFLCYLDNCCGTTQKHERYIAGSDDEDEALTGRSRNDSPEASERELEHLTERHSNAELD